MLGRTFLGLFPFLRRKKEKGERRNKLVTFTMSNTQKKHTYEITASSRTIDWIVVFDEEIPTTRAFLALDAWCIVL